MVCLPASQFCCGCSVTFGVKTVLFLNLAMNLFLLTKCTLHVMFGWHSMAMSNYPTEMAIMAFCLAGLPIIIMAFSGVCHRNEAQVRMYLYYMWLVIGGLTALILWEFVFTGACTNLSGVMHGEGKAFVCGAERWGSIFIVVVSLSIFGYFQHVVYSHCEDLTECGGGPELGDLAKNKDYYSSKIHQWNSAYASIEGMVENGDSGTIFQVTDGVGGGYAIFGGRYHDMSYPPRA